LDTNTGDVLWKTPLNHVGGYQVKGMVNGVLYAISWTTMTTEGITGTVFALNAQTGAQLWSIPTGVPLTQWGDMVVL